MQLIQLKIRGLGDVPETSWIPIKPNVTIARVNDQTAGRHLLHAIQTVNPPYDCLEELPFRNYPAEIITDTGYRKRIQPFRRTIALAVFTSPPALVAELGSITDPLYETDRIEVGRRLDYSRWINFVELASSSRWSEVSADVQRLADAASLSVPRQKPVLHLIGEMKSTDRIKGDPLNLLDDWLTDLRTCSADTDLIDSVMEKIRRAAFFADARRLVEKRMPLFLSSNLEKCIGFSGEAQRSGSEAQNRFAAIMLVDLLGSSDSDVNNLLDSLHNTGRSQNQYLCFIDEHCSLRARYNQMAISEDEITAASAPANRYTR